MLKNVFLITILCSLFYGCTKEKQKSTLTPTSDNIKISLVSGNNQTSGIGNPLFDSIVVKVTNNGIPLANSAVQFIGSGCNEDLVTELRTASDGTLKYLWRLSGNLGNQTLNIVAINKVQRVDSIAAIATATLPVGQKLISACTPSAYAFSICKLSTGRLIAGFAGITSIRYSDDDGVSWFPVKSFGANHTVILLSATPQDEIFAATIGEGIFYSKDAGATWINISPPTFNRQDQINDMTFTNSGKIIFTGLYKNIYISSDKGKSWTLSNTGLDPSAAYKNPSELQNGDLYLTSFVDILYKSTDNGSSWIALNDNQTHVTSIYSDNTGLFYKAIEAIDGGIFVSKDNGLTFTKYISLSNYYVPNMSVQQDGYFYYSQLSYAIYKVYPNSNKTAAIIYTDMSFPAYIVTRNNTFLFEQNGYIYY